LRSLAARQRTSSCAWPMCPRTNTCRTRSTARSTGMGLPGASALSRSTRERHNRRLVMLQSPNGDLAPRQMATAGSSTGRATRRRAAPDARKTPPVPRVGQPAASAECC
jgi:hypothetical protein